MFVGHCAPAFALCRIAPRVPLWAGLLGVEIVDVGWSALILAGVERATLDPSLPGNPLVLEHMPYTHSLLGGALVAALAGAAGARAWGGRAGVALAGCVISHWALDLLVHRPDLTIAGAPPRLGLGLWTWPTVEFGVEVGGLLAAASWYTAGPDARRAWVAPLVAVLVALQAIVQFGPAPPSLDAMAVGGVLVYLGAPAWVARRG